MINRHLLFIFCFMFTAYQPPPVTTSNYYVTPGSTVQTCTSPPGRTGTYSDTVRVPAARPNVNSGHFPSPAIVSEVKHAMKPILNAQNYYALHFSWLNHYL